MALSQDNLNFPLECSLMARETWVQSLVESYQRLLKWCLMPPCLTLYFISYGSRVKWRNPWKGVAPSLTPWCSSYRKRSLRVTLDYDRQLYLLLGKVFYIYIYYFLYIFNSNCFIPSYYDNHQTEKERY